MGCEGVEAGGHFGRMQITLLFDIWWYRMPKERRQASTRKDRGSRMFVRSRLLYTDDVSMAM